MNKYVHIHTTDLDYMHLYASFNAKHSTLTILSDFIDVQTYRFCSPEIFIVQNIKNIHGDPEPEHLIIFLSAESNLCQTT